MCGDYAKVNVNQRVAVIHDRRLSPSIEFYPPTLTLDPTRQEMQATEH
jgi:hypothetical protein